MSRQFDENYDTRPEAESALEPYDDGDTVPYTALHMFGIRKIWSSGVPVDEISRERVLPGCAEDRFARRNQRKDPR